jgi:RNA polymerase-associated protein RTF1
LMPICLKRDFFEKKIDEPYFDKLVENCFVRMGIGMNNENPVYRLAQIVGERVLSSI